MYNEQTIFVNIKTIIMVNVEGIVKVFIIDTLVCSVQLLQLKKYQMEKHNWKLEQWEEYFQIYKNNLNNIGLIKKKIECKNSPTGKHVFIPAPDSFDEPYCKYCHKTS